MRFVEPPHIILRKALIAGSRLSSFAGHLASFLARSLFGSSALALDGGSFRSKVAEWSQNTAMCALTEKVIFTDPYSVCDMNHWTTPQLDAFAEAIRSDVPLKLAAAALKAKFLGLTQALLHADLHSGSVMATEGSTFVIDPEFAFYGPMGFDVGAILSNLLMSYFSKAAPSSNGGADYAEWVLEQTIALHERFVAEFVALWDASLTSPSSGKGELFRAEAFGDRTAIMAAQKEFMWSIWKDSLGFTGMKMIRRIVGIAHVADLEEISDPDHRAACEKRSLLLARTLVMASQDANAGGLRDIQAVAAMARTIFAAPPPAQLL